MCVTADAKSHPVTSMHMETKTLPFDFCNPSKTNDRVVILGASCSSLRRIGRFINDLSFVTLHSGCCMHNYITQDLLNKINERDQRRYLREVSYNNVV